MKSTQNTRIRTRRIVAVVLVVGMAAVIFGFSHVPGAAYPPHPGFLNYVAHFCEYMVFGVLLTLAFTGGKLKVWQVALIALLIASAYAASDEFHQYFIPGRVSDPMDWLTDTLGASLGILLSTLLLRRIDSSRS